MIGLTTSWALSLCAIGFALPSIHGEELGEAFFNGTAYMEVQRPLTLHPGLHMGLSFRTCQGGRLFMQTNRQYSFSLDVDGKEGLVFRVYKSSRPYEARLKDVFNNNQWHYASILHNIENITLSAGHHQVVIANSTLNTELLMTEPLLTEDDGILQIGKGFVGCIKEGPNLVLSQRLGKVNIFNVEFGKCPLTLCSPEDRCHHQPCMTHGVCISQPDNYYCQCNSRFSGRNCEVDNGPPCQKMPCQNSGRCEEDNVGNYKCHCPSGFTGKHCETQISERLCDSNYCQNGGTCLLNPTENTPYCSCPKGYEGKDCSINVNDCLPNPCKNGGICIDDLNNYTCHCQNTGYVGKNCEENINECETKPCLNNGICFDTYGSYSCECPSGFTGQNCEMKVQTCNKWLCQHGGTCEDQPHGFKCHCLPGYSGVFCEVSASGCQPGACPPNTDCYETASGIQCVCKPGFTGPPSDCKPVDACVNAPCHNSGTCTALADGYSCSCAPGFTGSTCQTNIEECASQPCQHGGLCIDLINGYHCNCTADYTGASCEIHMDPCFSNPCYNNGTCHLKSTNDYYCECPAGFEGLRCEHNINECFTVTCPDNKKCVDGINRYECQCPAGLTGDNCTEEVMVTVCPKNNMCRNNSTCKDGIKNYTCECQSGWTGQFCEIDIDECKVHPNICNNGICLNNNGGYECFCRPGFSGHHCDLDFDECLSQPCENNATCENKINGFNCICPPGFTGQVCNVDINECESDPCQNGASCQDRLGYFTCVCPEGITGSYCETNIDDCESMPCENGGLCIDGINSFTCNCTDTGFEGLQCEKNIDDCSEDLCHNGAQCVDKVKDFECQCHPGYSGKTCETDINECEINPCQYNSTCLELSNQSYYNSNTSWPEVFQHTFNYSTAGGYTCVCIPGTTGDNCEINIQECESSPCHHGTCIDEIGKYHCECEDGFEGNNCEFEIDECERYQPCKHGICLDRIAGYFCECPPEYGGKNCSVELTGCKENQCQNNGSCKPYLENETKQLFNCSCISGYHGHVCDKPTTMSLIGDNQQPSYVMINTSRDEGYDIQFRFKTTLPNGLLAIGKGPTFYILQLQHGRLNLQSSILNKLEGVFIGSSLNNSSWQKVFVAINASHLVLAANEEQTIYPININEAANTSHTSFPTTYLGGTVPTLFRLTYLQQGSRARSFVGCVQDVVVNGQWVLPNETLNQSVILKDIEVGCARTAQCEPNPCQSGGHCTDLWRKFSCTCERPYLGDKCEYNYTAATFYNERVNPTYVKVIISQAARKAVRNIVDISMFIRTRQAQGGIFYIGSKTGVSSTDEAMIIAHLAGGELQVQIQFNGTSEGYGIPGTKLDDGYYHLVQVVRNYTLVQIKINGTEYVRKTIGASGQLDLQMLYLGGLPIEGYSPPSRYARQAPLRSKDPVPPAYFKGVIQDVQVSNGSHVMVVEFFPLEIQESELNMPLGEITIDRDSVLMGVVSDDSCADMPCKNNGTCHITWNDFFCECPRGFKGKQCDEMEFCKITDCPVGSQCQNLQNGYECVANVTLTGNTSGLHYRLLRGNHSGALDSIQLSYRTQDGGTLLHITAPDQPHKYFTVNTYNDQVEIAWNFEKDHNVLHLKKEAQDGDWATIILKMDNKLTGGFEGALEDTPQHLNPTNFSLVEWHDLIATANIFIGGVGENELLSSKNSYVTEGQSNDVSLHDENAKRAYKGCIGEVRIGGLLLPYFSPEDINMEKVNETWDYFVLQSSDPVTIDCYLCFDSNCINGGECEDPMASYRCNCSAGFTGEFCEENIDECVDHQCANNATCIDLQANYTCQCLPGWEGWLCDQNIDECASGPCLHSATCLDGLASYVCVCSEDYEGDRCQQKRLITCENRPCSNGATCLDVHNDKTADNYTCSCAPNYAGDYCDLAYCEVEPCRKGTCKKDIKPPVCECEPGFEGRFCDTNIDECKSNPCHNNGSCIDEIASFTCNCTGTGYQGVHCEEDIDECQDHPCGSNGICQNTLGSFVCSCTENFCGTFCNAIDPCVSNPCQNGGTCQPTCTLTASYHCICPPSFQGENCTEQSRFSANNVAGIVLIVGPVVAILLIAAGISLSVFLMMARKKRATRGTYSPSSQEYCNPRVELDNVMKPPPEERLI